MRVAAGPHGEIFAPERGFLTPGEWLAVRVRKLQQVWARHSCLASSARQECLAHTRC